jgi:predicted RNase H-like HicB family nuclease
VAILAAAARENLGAYRRRVIRHTTRYPVAVLPSIDLTVAFDEPDEEGWIVARVLEVPGALSQGRTRGEARDNVLDALRTVLTPDDELSGRRASNDLEHLRFVAAA